MKEGFRVALYSSMVLYVIIVLLATSFFVFTNLVSEFSFNYRFYIIIPLGLIMLFLMIDYYLKKEKSKNDKMKFLLYLFLTPCIFPLISILIFGIFNDNYILALGVYIPVGLIAAMLFLIANYFLEKKFNNKNLIKIKLILIISVFFIATTIYLLIEYGEITKPLKNILDIESDS
jgi:nitrate reductase NapE component